MASSILFVIGASGVGKTAAVERLQLLGLPGVGCYFFDSIGVPSSEVMLRDYGSGEAWQASATSTWVNRLASTPIDVAVLDGQTRPSFINAALKAVATPVRTQTVLLDCTASVRTQRLSIRGQPELATEQMNIWSAYLRGQADALGLPVIDTSTLSVEEVAGALQRHVVALRVASGTAA